MSRAGNLPVDPIGVVDIHAPTGNPYYGLKWREPDGSRRDTSGGKTLEGTRLKAAEIDARVSSAAGPLAVTSLEVMVEQFLFQARSTYQDKKTWKGSHLDKVTEAIHRCLRNHENTVTQNTSALRAFLLWGQQTGYFIVAQAELLPEAPPSRPPRSWARRCPSAGGGLHWYTSFSGDLLHPAMDRAAGRWSTGPRCATSGPSRPGCRRVSSANGRWPTFRGTRCATGSPGG